MVTSFLPLFFLKKYSAFGDPGYMLPTYDVCCSRSQYNSQILKRAIKIFNSIKCQVHTPEGRRESHPWATGMEYDGGP
jgi:hypothetical protein